ncbi:MAG: sigma-54-dependent Fis family transcriptional regulator [Phycisphaeraceae bacterium]|nr:sigma-54-dependent Fis family transcriptional regulator [Phycisphaeraceae bacterium]
MAPPYGPTARRAAAARCTILISGETGVGKGRFAKWLHAQSPRHAGPFIPVNCGAIPESLIDSQLFGHARGAFSGATHEHVGLVRAADGGTLFLDEVGELPASAQMRLLRLLQEREVQPVGYPRPVIVDVRVIAATNVDLHAAVAERRFREDLLYRLDVVSLTVPPLRERRAEIQGLIDHFNAEFAGIYDQAPLAFLPEARSILLQHPWPGNIRQLRAVLERLHVLAPGEPVTVEKLAGIGQLERPGAGAVPDLDQVRAAEIRRLLAERGGSISQVATALGVHRSTIYRWLRSNADPAPKP